MRRVMFHSILKEVLVPKWKFLSRRYNGAFQIADGLALITPLLSQPHLTYSLSHYQALMAQPDAAVRPMSFSIGSSANLFGSFSFSPFSTSSTSQS